MAFNMYQDIITKDLVVENNNLKLTSNNTEYISQKIENEFLFFLGEYWLNRNLGIPYLSEENKDRDNNTKNIFVKNPDINYINTVFIRALNNTEGIINILELTSNYDSLNRELLVTFRVQITDGEILTQNIEVTI